MALIPFLSLIITSCGGDDVDNEGPDIPDIPDVSEPLSIIGRWTVEDYNTGKYTTLDFKSNGEYTLLEPFYDRTNKAAGRWKYDEQTQTLALEHFSEEYDFEEHGNDPDFWTDLSLKCILSQNSITLIGEDCEELGLDNPSVLNAGGYSGISPDFKSMLCKAGVYQSRDEWYGISEDMIFRFDNSGEVEFEYTLTRTDDRKRYGHIAARGTFLISGYQLICRFDAVSKEENNLSVSTYLWDEFTNNQAQNVILYLALDKNNKVIISYNPLY